MNITTLYRPVGETELQLIAQSGYRQFPPRLAWQPLFYPVLNETYAIQIAQEWDTQDAFSGYAGYVLSFDLPSDFLSRYPIQNVGSTHHNELWVPAADLHLLNNNIVDCIRLLHSFYGAHYKHSASGA